jgi:transcriptional regulator with XRE-family HTH domain
MTSPPPPNAARKWVGHNVRHHRTRLELTIGELADRVSALGFPLERTQISKIENGHTNVDVEKLLALAAALDVIPDRLLRDPEDLDRALYVRLRDRWEHELREAKRHESIAVILLEELQKFVPRLPRDERYGLGADDDLADRSWEIEHTEWRLIGDRPAPESEGYADFLERLVNGRGLVEEYVDSFPDLTPFIPKPTKKGSR